MEDRLALLTIWGMFRVVTIKHFAKKRHIEIVHDYR